ncbi:hypothetical protein N665_1597s0003 [Sinapis alba]|nr:hypothetical protein N665_1597s0003 [Sinapis alba]
MRFSSWISARHDYHSSRSTSNDHDFFPRRRSSSDEAAAAAAEVLNSSGSIACVTQAKAFQDCLDENETDISKCQSLMDMWCNCKKEFQATLTT